MPSYAALAGHQPSISIAELSATVPGFTLRKIFDRAYVLFESPAELTDEFLRRLGGTVLLAKRVTENAVTLEDIPAILRSELESARRGKVTFALRAVGVPSAVVHDLYRTCKAELKERGRPSRYVGNEKTPAAAVLLRSTQLLTGKGGCELTLIKDEDDLWVGRTFAAQDVNAYAKRDMEKPVRDTTVGLLPPKLAQILLNFGAWLVRGDPRAPEGKKSAKEEPLTVFDPFCGTGVIPLECLVRGWNVLASDVSLKAVNGTTKNIEWLRKEEKILKKDTASTVFKHDALKPFPLKLPPDVIVTETTLGPGLSDRPSAKDAQKMRTENDRLQCEFLKNCAISLPGVPIVCAWPVWKIKGDQVFLERAWKEIDALGYRPMLPANAEPSVPGRFSLLYRRPDQFVGREIVLLKPRKSA